MIIRTNLFRSGAVAGMLILALLAPAVVSAHAELLETSPADGATVEGTPTEISATFSEALEVDGSGIALRDAAGEEIADGGLDPDDPARLLIADVPDLAPGEYEVQMTIVTDDGHVDRPTWSFTVVAPPTPSPSPTPAPTASAAPTPSATSAPSPTAAPSAASTPSASPGPDEEPAGSTSDVILPIVVVLAIVVVGVGVLLSRRNRVA